MPDDKRSTRFVFVPFCLCCPAFQARGIVKYDWQAVMRPVVDVLLNNNVNVVQMPCPEAQYGGYAKGLMRPPRGYELYDVPDFRGVCGRIAIEVEAMVEAILKAGYTIDAVLGVERSPSCSVKHQYTHMGLIEKPGLFMGTLMTRLPDLTYLGINRSGTKGFVQRLSKLLAAS